MLKKNWEIDRKQERLHCTTDEEGKHLSKQSYHLMNGRLCSSCRNTEAKKHFRYTIWNLAQIPLFCVWIFWQALIARILSLYFSFFMVSNDEKCYVIWFCSPGCSMCQSTVFLTPSHLSPVSLPASTRWEGPSFLCVCVLDFHGHPCQLKLKPQYRSSIQVRESSLHVQPRRKLREHFNIIFSFLNLLCMFRQNEY